MHVSFGEPCGSTTCCDKCTPVAAGDPLEKDARPPWLGDAVDEIAARDHDAHQQRGVRRADELLIALALLATPRQAMLENDLDRQLELYASLLRQAPYSPDVSDHGRPTALSIVRHGEQHGRAPAAQASARRHAADDGRERGAADLLPQQRAAPDGAAVAGRLLPSSTTPHDAHRRHPAPDVAYLSVHARRAVPALARGRSLPGVVDGDARRPCAITACSSAIDGGAQWRRAADGHRRGGAVVGARAGDDADHRALLPGDRGAAQVGQLGASARTCSNRSAS